LAPGEENPLPLLRVRGPSMAPTLRSGDIVLVTKPEAVKKGDLVLVRWAQRPGQLSVKRAVHQVGGLWYVLGDNQFGSTDSRTLGPAEVLKVVRWRVWPRPKRLS
jgi:phage repressor protein C with HTH and peptisase S24 domain